MPNNEHIKNLWDVLNKNKKYNTKMFKFWQKLKFHENNKNLALLHMKDNNVYTKHFCIWVLKDNPNV